jgi:hypothetical protein
MTRILPDVRNGDRLTGVHTNTGAVRHFYSGRPIGTIDEPGFARAFFGIWLDPKSSRAAFALIAWLALTPTIVYVAFSVAAISHCAWGAELSADPVERTRVTATRESLALASVVVASRASGSS